ncbi:MAG: histidinol dehydrogenase, partial [Deltaproteobacteria bacterium]|nr:histidinol dehydrogenase [Deltaproteobacteria bacterium]
MKDLLFILPGNEERLKKRLGPRKRLFDSTLVSDISALFQEVASSGDRAIKEATERFDRIRIEDIQVSEIYAEKCIDSLTPKFTGAIENAIRNIREVNELLMPEPAWQKEIRPGTIIGEKITPLDSVGLYIPARKGTLVSTALMLVTSAKVAGVGNIVVAMPPQEDGKPNPATVAAARIAGAHRVVSGNGAALVAGMTFGTDSIPEVAGIFGPGPAGIAAAMSVAFSYGKKTM